MDQDRLLTQLFEKSIPGGRLDHNRIPQIEAMDIFRILRIVSPRYGNIEGFSQLVCLLLIVSVSDNFPSRSWDQVVVFKRLFVFRKNLDNSIVICVKDP